MSSDKIIVLCVLVLMSLGFQCGKKLDCRESRYQFSLPIRAYPDKDSIHIGDTVWLEVNEPTSFQDAAGGMINYGGATNLGTAIAIAEFISPGLVNTDANGFFKFRAVQGVELFRPDTIRFREYSFAETNNRYVFKLAVIPQKKGVYKLFVSNASNVIRKNDQCTKADFGINFENTNQHYYYNEVSFPGIVLSGKTGVYLFKVI